MQKDFWEIWARLDIVQDFPSYPKNGNIDRMVEAERLFAEMLNNVFFRETPFTVFVFFNKWDVFKDRLSSIDGSIQRLHWSRLH